MWNEYELTLSEATQLKDDELSDASEIKRLLQIQRMKSENSVT